MKKIINLLLVLVLVFSLVACSTNNETTKETNGETVVESKDESVSETTDESSAETKVETNSESSSVEVTAIALKDNTVLVQGEGLEQQIVTLQAGNQTSLVPGHKYVYSQENPEIKDPLVVENIDMLGKAIGAPIDAKLINTLIEKVEGVKIVDTRSEAEFAKGSAKGAINLPVDKLEELLEKASSEEGLEALKEISKDDVVVLLGADEASNANVASELLYKFGRVSVSLNGGSYGEYKAH
ncbi:MAG: rhodanese-like domain-containing protein [Helcococcus sp.]|nr:rhodanese-like domain-containing protein [Helcococcus sp.]